MDRPNAVSLVSAHSPSIGLTDLDVDESKADHASADNDSSVSITDESSKLATPPMHAQFLRDLGLASRVGTATALAALGSYKCEDLPVFKEAPEIAFCAVVFSIVCCGTTLGSSVQASVYSRAESCVHERYT